MTVTDFLFGLVTTAPPSDLQWGGDTLNRSWSPHKELVLENAGGIRGGLWCVCWGGGWGRGVSKQTIWRNSDVTTDDRREKTSPREKQNEHRAENLGTVTWVACE